MHWQVQINLCFSFLDYTPKEKVTISLLCMHWWDWIWIIDEDERAELDSQELENLLYGDESVLINEAEGSRLATNIG